MEKEKRKGDAPLPDNLKEVLNEAQQQALPGLKLSGWEPRYLRRPLFQEPELVIYNPGNNRTGVLESDGSIRLQTGNMTRKADSLEYKPDPDDPLVWTR